MSGRGPTAEELRAADIVVAFVGGAARPRPASGGQKTHDFDIELADGRHLALEVTRIADPVAMQFEEAMRSAWPTPKLSADWYVWVPAPEPHAPTIRINRVVKPIGEALAVIERHGWSQINLWDYDYYLPGHPITGQAAIDDAIRSLTALDVTYARSTGGQEQPPTSELSLFSHGSRSPTPANSTR
jgi:hypothetical protein